MMSELLKLLLSAEKKQKNQTEDNGTIDPPFAYSLMMCSVPWPTYINNKPVKPIQLEYWTIWILFRACYSNL